MADNGSSSQAQIIKQGLSEASQKIEAKVQEAINEHVSSSEFSASKHGLDFLQVKNSLMLTYLIELTYDLRCKLRHQNNDKDESNNNNQSKSLHRLTVMKHALDKTRSLEKKLRYQIDKLMSAGTTATSFVSTEEGKEAEDPLHYRPDTSALLDGDEQEEDNEDAKDDSDNDDGSSVEMDDDLRAARATVAAFKSNKNKSKTSETDQDDDDNDGIYRAPRLAAVPYNLDKTDKEAERQKRKLQRMRTSELAQTLRSQYGDAPEQDDIHGGTELGKQRESSRRFAQQQEEKTRYEEDAMIRLTTTRKEKKERKQIMRQESSNLSAIADLGNIVRDTSLYQDDERRRKKSRREEADMSPSEPYVDRQGRQQKKGTRGKTLHAKNSLQAALFGGDSSSSKSKKKASKGRR
mmetsp:Transcript_3362/g.7026  ORF Transcript_3362/g.7026 Transcript_3362/m.7026 type:complete len:407 (+) Transcript_3362:29-1249(+)